MRRITKLSSLLLALLVLVPGLLVLDFFGGAGATPDAPLLWSQPMAEPVSLVRVADEALPGGATVLAYVAVTSAGDTIVIRERAEDGALLGEWRASDDAWEVTRLALARDGATVAAATADGRVIMGAHPFTSFRVFAAGSPVTDLALHPGGAFLAAVTYHGDLLVFQRDEFLAQGSPAFHVPAPLPAGALPAIPGATPDPAFDLLGTVREAAGTATGALAVSLRPFTHVAFIGVPRTAGDALGLFIAAATGYGEIYVYDLARLATVEGAVAEPYVTRLGDAPCERVGTLQFEVEVPCSRAALGRFLDRFPAPEDVPAEVVVGLGRALANSVPLAPLLSPLPVHAQNGVAAILATDGPAEAGSQLLVAALRAGTVEAFRVRAPAAVATGQAVPNAPIVDRLWRMDDSRGVSHAALAPFHMEHGTRAATITLVSPASHVTVHRIAMNAQSAPTVYLSTRIETAGAPVGITHLALSRSAPSDAQAIAAGRYLLVGTQDGEIRLFQVRDREPGTAPALLWVGQSPLQGVLATVALQQEGGVVVAGGGLAVYANLVTARIDAPQRVDRHKVWRAEARIEAPDTPVDSVAWRVEPVETRTSVSVQSATGSSVFQGSFAHEGLYRVVLIVTDQRGISLSVVQSLVVGGLNPVVKVASPGIVAVGEEVVLSFLGTHDPNLPAGTGHGITRIEVYPYGDARQGLADLDTLSYRFHAEGPTGIFRAVVIAYDAEGRSTRATAQLQLTAPGFTLLGDAGGTNPLLGLVSARDSGHTAAFGGLHGARLELRAPDGAVLHRDGTSLQPGPGAAYASGALTPAGDIFIGGRSDGSAVRVVTADPASRTTLEVFEGRPVRWTFVSADGERVLFVSADGRLAAAPANLSMVTHRFEAGVTLSRVVADERLIHVAALTAQGRLLVLDGHRPDRGVRDEHVPEGTVTALAITPNLDPMGRAWVFLGLGNGRVEIIRILVHEFQPVGSALYDANGMAVVSISAGRVDARSRYMFAAVSKNDRLDCGPGTSRPCGFLYLIDSRGPRLGDMPIPERSAELAERPAFVFMDADARRFLVAGAAASPKVFTFDTIWDDGPLQVLTGFGTRARDGATTASAATHLLLENGRIAWIFAPPRASILVGPHDEEGRPQWDGRVHAHRDVTLSASNSSSGHGSIIAYRWHVGSNESLTMSEEVHRWTTTGWHTVILTVTSRVTHPVETLVSDRARVIVPVHAPPPVARLVASPFDADAGAVRVTSGEVVRFDASQSSSPVGARVVDYRFNTGTGFAANRATPTFDFSYPKPGVYQASVRVTDQHGSTSLSPSIRIEVANRAPTAAFSFEQSDSGLPVGRVMAHRAAVFDASPSADPDGSIMAWEWEFPGGVMRTAKQVTHTFHATGDQVVRLRVKDDLGAWSQWMERIVQVEKGIRVDATQDPANGATTAPTAAVRVAGAAHDMKNHPAGGDPIAGATITVRVFFDGFSATPASTPYETRTYTTDAAGTMEHVVGFNQAGVAYQPGKYRVELTGTMSGVYGTLTSGKAVTTFWVDA